MNNRLFTVFALAFPLVMGTACVDDVGAGKTAAEVVEPAPTDAKAKASTNNQVAGQSIAVDTQRSELKALGAKVTATHPIAFDTWKGELRITGDQLVGVDATIEMSSLRSDKEKLTGHLKSADFFEVERFPRATFRSSSVEAQKGADGSTHTITGALTMHGVTKTVRFPATVSTTATEVRMKTEFVIDRQDFGITYAGKADDLIQDNVVLTADLVGKRG